MKKAWTSACALFFVAIASFAQTPSQPPLTREALAAILGEPLVTGSCPTPPAQVFAAQRPRTGLDKGLCNATANCSPGTVTCSGNHTTTSCSSADRNCAIGERGHVTCDGVTVSCPTACTSCTGTPKQVACCTCDQTGGCFDCCRCDGGSGGSCSLACG